MNISTKRRLILDTINLKDGESFIEAYEKALEMKVCNNKFLMSLIEMVLSDKVKMPVYIKLYLVEQISKQRT